VLSIGVFAAVSDSELALIDVDDIAVMELLDEIRLLAWVSEAWLEPAVEAISDDATPALGMLAPVKYPL
jgi:hypothetical protein